MEPVNTESANNFKLLVAVMYSYHDANYIKNPTKRVAIRTQFRADKGARRPVMKTNSGRSIGQAVIMVYTVAELVEDSQISPALHI